MRAKTSQELEKTFKRVKARMSGPLHSVVCRSRAASGLSDAKKSKIETIESLI